MGLLPADRLDTVLRTYNINVLRDASIADTIRFATQQNPPIASAMVPGGTRFNDIRILLTAHQNNLGLVTGDVPLMNTGLRNLVHNMQYRHFEKSVDIRIENYKNMREKRIPNNAPLLRNSAGRPVKRNGISYKLRG